MSSLLEELAIDAEDFSDLAHLLKVDRSTVERAVLKARPTSIAALVTEVRRAATATATAVESTAPDTPLAAPASRTWGGGWRRWTRTRGDARVHQVRHGPRSALVTS